MSAVDQAFELEAYLRVERTRVEQALDRLMRRTLEDAAPGAAPAIYALEAGGKRLRPILFAAAFDAVLARGAPGSGRGPESATDDAVYDGACALELVHTYSLVHDDLPCMDDDDLRRGRPTAHRIHGARSAALAGAALVPTACRALASAAQRLGLPPEVRMDLVRELCAAAGAGGMVGGQVLDLEAEGRHVPLSGLERIHRRKTGALLAASLRLGGGAARADQESLDALETFGHALGLAFQIVDDVLDVTGSSATLGKTAGRDQALAKATFPALLGLDAARGRAAGELREGLLALRRAGLATPALVALGRYVLDRDR